ncbi:MAG: hypothetical protein E6R13_04770 [Spirochaetes bacterium]|nr:MAG: hypothetical protein E6R13_04770 [Spirochaetota bacterium]
MIRIDTKQKERKLNNIYNQIGFLAQVLIPLLDEMKETTQPKRQFKKACNDIISECDKFTREHFKHFQNFGEIPNPTGEKGHDAEDIYNVTAKAYDEAFKFFTERTANEVTSIMELIRNSEDKGLKLEEVNISYKPILK